MRIGVVSDTHGVLDNLEAAISRLGKLDGWIHLGDVAGDAKQIAKRTGLPLQSVRGNCDFSLEAPAELIYQPQPGIRLLVCHGHRYGVKSGLQRLQYKAQEEGCCGALFGHTHNPAMEKQGELLLLNPGSLSLPHAGKRPSCAVLEILGGNRLQAEIILL